MPTTAHVTELAKDYVYVARSGHVVGPLYGQVYSAQHVPEGYIVELAGVGIGHFREAHPTAEEV